MSVSAIQTDWTYGIWIDFANVTCDLCDAVYPPDGRLHEFPEVLRDARGAGWTLLPLAGLACCRECHQRIVDDHAENAS